MKAKYIGECRLITKYKIYEVLNPGTKTLYYSIIDDYGHHRIIIPKKYLIPIEELREEKINNILSES